MGFEQLKYSPPQSAASQQQSPVKHKLVSHSKREDKKPLRSYQFGSSADHLVIYVFAVRPILLFRKAFKSFDGSPVNKHKLKKKVFRLLSNSSFLRTLTDHIICFQIFCNLLYSYFNYKKKELIVTKLNFTATRLDKILAVFQPRSNFAVSN